MAKVDVRYSKMVGDTPAFAIISEGVLDLVEHGNYTGRGGFPVGWDHECLYAVSADNDVVAVLTFQKLEARNSYYITLGYTEPSSREQGIYRLLWNELVRLAQNNGIRCIQSETHVNNKASQKMMEKTGRRLEGFAYVFDVPRPEPIQKGAKNEQAG
jgi:ribosomal protein S18 acetylase RimI-like enzyme